MGNHSDERAFGIGADGLLRDAYPYCGKWSCSEGCWLRKLNLVAKATRLYLEAHKLGEVWLGLMTQQQYNGAREWRRTNRDIGVMGMVTSYRETSDVEVLATHDLIPSKPVMQKGDIDWALTVWVAMGRQYRPKRVTADWSLDLAPSGNEYIAKVPESLVSPLYRLLGERGYDRTTDLSNDPLWKQKVYGAIADLMQTDSDYLSG